ncbi:hypothetical protein ACXR2U_12080 [Jatrophihabitans sp. YIM 134969]
MWTEAVDSFERLRGDVVAAWSGTEWALDGGEDGTPAVFEHPAVPFQQLWALDLVLAAGGRRTVRTYQDGTAFGLYVGEPLTPPPPGGMARPARLALPTGRLDVLDVRIDDDVVAEVLLGVAGREVLLLAGEVEPTRGGGLEFVRCDESVLVFDDPAVADTVSWRRPRSPRA